METCSESELTTGGVGESSRRMSPITRVIDPGADRRSRLVIVLGAHDNKPGVSVLMVGSVAGEGYPRGW
jgi:hypothetical protein